MKILNKLTYALFTLGSLSVLSSGSVYAQNTVNYPGKQPVSIVVGFSAGGSTDLLGRLLAKAFAEDLDGNFIVENRPGANSNIANGYVARAKPDGHTLLMVPFGLPINQYLYKEVPYDFKKDFAPIALVAKVPNAIVVKADSSLQNVKQYVDQSISSKQSLTYATPGIGSSLHLAGELFKYDTKANLLHVPYKGSSPALMAVIAGDTDSAFDNLSTVAPHVEAGKLRILAVTSKTRSDSFPDTPTVAESGFPNFEINSYFGLAAPAGTPPEIIERLNKATLKALRNPEISEHLKKIGAIIEDTTPETFTSFLNSEGERWGPVIKAADIQPN